MTEGPQFARRGRETWNGVPFPRTPTSLQHRVPVRDDGSAERRVRWGRIATRLAFYPLLAAGLLATLALCIPLQGAFFARLVERLATDVVRGLEVRVGSARIEATAGRVVLQTVVVVDRESGAVLRLGGVELGFDPFEVVASAGRRGLAVLHITAAQRLTVVGGADTGWTLDEQVRPIVRRIRDDVMRRRALAARGHGAHADEDAGLRPRVALPDVRVDALELVARRVEEDAPDTPPRSRAAGARHDVVHIDRLLWRGSAGRLSAAALLEDAARRSPGRLHVRIVRCDERLFLEAGLTQAQATTLPLPVEVAGLRATGWLTPSRPATRSRQAAPGRLDVEGRIERIAFDTSAPHLAARGLPNLAWEAGPLRATVAAEWAGAGDRTGDAARAPGRLEIAAALEGEGLDVAASVARPAAGAPLVAQARLGALAPFVALLEGPEGSPLAGPAVISLEGPLEAQLALAPAGDEPPAWSLTTAGEPLQLSFDPAGLEEHVLAAAFGLHGVGLDPSDLSLRLREPTDLMLDDHHVATLDIDPAAGSPALHARGIIDRELVERLAPGSLARLDPVRLEGTVAWEARLPIGPGAARRAEGAAVGPELTLDLAGISARLPDKWLTAPVGIDEGRVIWSPGALALEAVRVRLDCLTADLHGRLGEGELRLDGVLGGSLDSLEKHVTDVRTEMLLDGDASGTLRLRAGAAAEPGRPLGLAATFARVADSFRSQSYDLRVEATATGASVAHLSMPVMGTNLSARVHYEQLALVFDELQGDLGATRGVRGRGRLTFRPGNFPHLALEVEADGAELAEWFDYWHKTPPPPPEVLAARDREKRFEMDLDIRLRRWRASDPLSSGLRLGGTRGAARLNFYSSVGPGSRSAQRLTFLPGTALELHGGRVTVEGALDIPNPRNPEFANGRHFLVVRGRDLDLGPLVGELRREPAGVEGRLAFDGFVRGPLEPAATALEGLEGAWRLRVRRSTLLRVPYFRFLVDTLGLAEASQQGFADLDGTILLHRGRAWSSNLLLHHPVAALIFQGTTSLATGSLAGRVLVRVEDASYYETPVISQIMAAVGAAIDDVSNLLVSLRLAGTLAQPRTVARPTAGMVDQLRAIVGAEDMLPSSTNDMTTFPFAVPHELDDVDFAVQGAW